MHSRAADIGASLILTSQPGQGTAISVRFGSRFSPDARAPVP